MMNSIVFLNNSRYLDNISPLSNGQYQVHLVRSASHYPLPALVAVFGTTLVSAEYPMKLSPRSLDIL